MGLLRTLIFAVVSDKTAAAMEAESRAWVATCPRCGREISIWDLGGIRYKAYGNSRNLLRCPTDGLTWHRLSKKM